jgi:hypothetical protein
MYFYLMRDSCKIEFTSIELNTFDYWHVGHFYLNFITSSKCLSAARGKESYGSHITLEIYDLIFAKEYPPVFLLHLCSDEDFALLKDRSLSILRISRVIIDLIKHRQLEFSDRGTGLENCD